MTYDCMTPDELALWSQQVARARVKAPCADCPAWFAAEARAAGCCKKREPVPITPERAEQMRLAQRRYYRRRRGRTI